MFKNAAKEISKLGEQLATILNGEILESNISRISDIKGEIKKLWDQEEKYWGSVLV